MARTGRPRKPTSLRLVDGSAKVHPERVPKDEPQVVDPLGPPPAAKSLPAKLRSRIVKLWKENAPFWATVADRDTFLSYCTARARAQWAEAQLQRGKYWIPGSTGSLVPHPAVKIMMDSQRHADRMASEFGLTPSSRSRVKAPSRPKRSGIEKLMEDR